MIRAAIATAGVALAGRDSVRADRSDRLRGCELVNGRSKR
jgi:hypothetical protein